MEKNIPSLYQPNIITQARYSFTEYEMRVLLYVIKQIQDKLNKNDVEFNRNMFGEIDYKIQFYLADMMVSEGEKNHARIRKALKDLRDKSFEVEDEKHWFNVGFINYGRYNKDVKKWELQVSFLLMPYMVSLAKGFTAYQLETILNLNTNSQRLYLMFSQYHDTGIFRISAEELRYKLGLEKKYERYGDFKKWVLSAAEKELKLLFDSEKSDVWVKLEKDKKERGKEDFDRTLTFKIFYSQRKIVQMEQAKAETLRYCTQILQSMFPDHQAYANSLLGYLVGKMQLKTFSERLERMEDQSQAEGKPLATYAPL
ncbi:RepB family plasmid replication initiator protein, partial [bacterium]